MTNFFELCRQRTGKSILDSGDHYGRHYEQPPIPEDTPMIREWDKGCPATLETTVYLNEAYEIDEELQAAWIVWNEEHGEDLDWFTSAMEFMEQAGYESCARDNVYNHENDLSQVFVWEVWRKPGREHLDWIYDDEAVIVVHVHTGCDVRGGYTSPVFCRTKGEYTAPVDLCAQYRIDQLRENGVELSDEERQKRDEEWQCGYSSYPYGALEKDVARWFEFTRTRDSVCVQLNDGTIAKVTAEGPYLG